MAVPLFERQVLIGLHYAGSVAGQAILANSEPTWTELIHDLAEQTLFDSLRWTARDFATPATGQILIAIQNVEYGADTVKHLVGSWVPTAGAAAPAPWASGRIVLGLPVPAGFSIFVAHSVAAGALGGSFCSMDFVLECGALR